MYAYSQQTGPSPPSYHLSPCTTSTTSRFIVVHIWLAGYVRERSTITPIEYYTEGGSWDCDYQAQSSGLLTLIKCPQHGQDHQKRFRTDRRSFVVTLEKSDDMTRGQGLFRLWQVDRPHRTPDSTTSCAPEGSDSEFADRLAQIPRYWALCCVYPAGFPRG